MPFFWSTVVQQGVAYGNRDVGSAASVRNSAWISYPGYNELLTGRPDPRITNNAQVPNPNVTVLEWLNSRPAFAGRVAASTAWRVFASILNVERSRLPLFVTPQRSAPDEASPRIAELERWMADIPPITRNEHFDVFAYQAALEMIDTRRPRVFLLGLGEPDEWAHARRYDRYLHSIRRCDRFVQELWEKLQAMPGYRGATTLVLTTDHGRGVNLGDWTRHNRSTPHSNETWLAVLGPDTPALGERRDAPPVFQAQVAATIAALLGEDFRAAVPEAEPPVAEILGELGRVPR
jgi:arylsulfatase A-like enzyme